MYKGVKRFLFGVLSGGILVFSGLKTAVAAEPEAFPPREKADAPTTCRYEFLSSYGYNGIFSDLGYLRGFGTRQIFLYKPLRCLGVGAGFGYSFFSGGPLAVAASSVWNSAEGQWEYIPAHEIDRAAQQITLGPAVYWMPTVKERHNFQVGIGANISYLYFKDIYEHLPSFFTEGREITRQHHVGFALAVGAGYRYQATDLLGIGFHLQYTLFKNSAYTLSGLGAFFTVGFRFN